MNSKVTKARGTKGPLPQAPSPLMKLDCADEDHVMAVPTVANDVAAWWAELDAEVRADRIPATADEIDAADAMPTIDVSAAVSELLETLPSPPYQATSNVLPFRRSEEEHCANAFLPGTPSVTAYLPCDRGTAQNNRFGPASHLTKAWDDECQTLLDPSYMELRTTHFDKMLVAFVAFRRDARLKSLVSALELAHEIAQAEYGAEIRCLTLDGPGNDRYSAQWSYLGDWFHDHYYRCRSTARKVLASLHEVLKQEDRANRNWTFRQLRGTVVFTVIGAEHTVGQCGGRAWQARIHERTARHYPNLMMTVIEGSDVMSVVPHSVDDAMRSATVVYQSAALPESDNFPSYLPGIKSALNGEEAFAHE